MEKREILARPLDALALELLRDGPEAVIIADRDGVIRFWNRAAERLFGHGTGEACGQSLDIIIPERLRARHWDGFRRTIETGESRYGPDDLLKVPAVTKDGGTISLEFRVHPFADMEGRIEAIAAILRDATAQFEETRTLRKRIEELESAAR